MAISIKVSFKSVKHQQVKPLRSACRFDCGFIIKLEAAASQPSVAEAKQVKFAYYET